MGKAAKFILEELAKRADAGDSLAMDYASRMQRAADQGYTPTYHGTTQDIPESGFNMGGYAESDLGQGIYSTTDPHDASFNYADPETSQDLIGKIDRRAEQLEGELDIDYDVAKQQARQELVGSPQVHPTMARTENPVRIGGDETEFNLMGDVDIDATWDDASEQIAEQYADEIADGSYDAEEIKELTTDLARDLAYENDYVDEPAIFESLRNVAHRFDDADIEQAIMDLRESGYESMGAEQLIDTLKGSEGIQYAMSGDSGDLASGELIRQAFEDAGYDSIIDATPNKKWGSESGRGDFMPSLEGTEHVIVFNPNQMRSTSAAFDPAKRESSNLLAGIGALGAGTTAALYTPEENAAMAGELVTSGAEDVGSITADEYPQLESIADFLDKYVQTPLDPLMGSPLEGVSGYLRDFGRKDRTTGERLGSAYGAALDVAPL